MSSPKDPAAFAAYRARMRAIALERGYGKWMQGRTSSPESIEKTRAANLGKTISVEHRQALSEARRREMAAGKEPFGGEVGRAKAQATTLRLRRGRTYEDIYGERAEEERRTRRETNRRTGERRRKPEPQRPKHNADHRYQDWRRAVFERDNFTCQICHERSGQLHAHHLQSWAEHVELRYDIDNGTTLHESCHRDLHAGRAVL